jgi:hypothetical protein
LAEYLRWSYLRGSNDDLGLNVVQFATCKVLIAGYFTRYSYPENRNAIELQKRRVKPLTYLADSLSEADLTFAEIPPEFLLYLGLDVTDVSHLGGGTRRLQRSPNLVPGFKDQGLSHHP